MYIKIDSYQKISVVWKKNYAAGFQPISMDTDTKDEKCNCCWQTKEANVLRDIVFSSSTSIEEMMLHHKTTYTHC